MQSLCSHHRFLLPKQISVYIVHKTFLIHSNALLTLPSPFRRQKSTIYIKHILYSPITITFAYGLKNRTHDQTKCPIYVTRVTSKSAAQAISRARLQGVNVFGETLASSIGCALADVKPENALYYVTSPPIRRDSETPRSLLKSLAL